MSNSIKFNKTLIATVVATSMLTACGGDDVKVQDTVTEVVEVPVNVPVATPAEPVEVTASAHGSVVDGSSMAPLVGAMVDIHVAGQVFAATVTGNSFTAEGLPTNSDFIAVVSAAGKATAYTMGTTSDGAINVDTVELFNVVTSSVTVTDMMGDNVSGLSLYIAAAGKAGSMSSGQADDAAEYISSVPSNFATETDGVYTFTLPANGMSYDIEVAGDFSDLAVVGGTLAVTSGQNPTVYVDDADEATMFSVSFGLTFADGSVVTSGPETLSLNDGDVTASWDSASAEYVIEGLSFADIMSPLALDMVEIDGVMFAATDVAAAGLDSFSDATASSSIALAMNTDTDNGEALPVEYVVSHAKAVAGTSATMTIVFNQPVEIIADALNSYSERVEHYTGTLSAKKNPIYYIDADGNRCESDCPTATVSGSLAPKLVHSQAGKDELGNDLLDEDGNTVWVGYVGWKADDYATTSTYTKAVFAPDSAFRVVNGGRKITSGELGWITSFKTLTGDSVSNTLVSEGSGKEISWNGDKTVLTLSLSDEEYNKAEDIYPQGYSAENKPANGYFNAKQLQQGQDWLVSFVAKPVSGNVEAIDVLAIAAVPDMVTTATVDNMFIATGDSVDHSQSLATNSGFDFVSYNNQNHWYESAENTVQLTGATGLVISPAGRLITYLEGDTIVEDGELCNSSHGNWKWADFGFGGLPNRCEIESFEPLFVREYDPIPDTEDTCTSAHANFSYGGFGSGNPGNYNGCWITYSQEESFDAYMKLVEFGIKNVADDTNLPSYDKADYEEVAMLNSVPVVKNDVKNAYFISPEKLSGNIEVVSVTKSFWDANANDGLGASSTAEVAVGKLFALNLDNNPSYDSLAENKFYIKNTWDKALIKNSDNPNRTGVDADGGTEGDVDVAQAGDAFGAPILTGFSPEITGMNYLYELPGNFYALGDNSGANTHVTVNLSLTTESGEEIYLQNVVFPVK